MEGLFLTYTRRQLCDAIRECIMKGGEIRHVPSGTTYRFPAPGEECEGLDLRAKRMGLLIKRISRSPKKVWEPKGKGTK